MTHRHSFSLRKVSKRAISVCMRKMMESFSVKKEIVMGFRSLDADLSAGTRTEKKEELRMVNHNFGDGEIGFFN